MKEIQYPQVHNGICYPGMCNKFGVDIDGERYLLKYAETETEILSLFSEKIGTLLCQQMSIPASQLQLVKYGNKTALLAKDFMTKEDCQYFPLASYFEEKIDYSNTHVDFTYDTFISIVKEKCPSSYSSVIYTFWLVSIIDYLLCNARSAGNIGFIDDGEIRLTPIFDNSSWLLNCQDKSFVDLSFPKLLMKFSKECNSGYMVLRYYQNSIKDNAMNYFVSHFDMSQLHSIVETKEEIFLLSVIEYRYNKLFR